MGARRRADRMYGVEVRKRPEDSKDLPGDPRASEVLIRRICLRYEDGRKVCFIPDAGEEFFSRDEVRRIVGLMHTGSEAMEWGLTSSERYPGTGPYDTGAV